MTGTSSNGFELSVTRHIAAPPARVWEIMTKRMAEWWCPKPWTVEIIEQDWRAGGRSAMVMHGPDGQNFPNEGIILEVVPGRRWVSTDAFTAGWVPHEAFMVGTWEIAPESDGTRYTASARHWSEDAMKRHTEMGFMPGWSTAADQLAALAEAAG